MFAVRVAARAAVRQHHAVAAVRTVGRVAAVRCASTVAVRRTATTSCRAAFAGVAAVSAMAAVTAAHTRSVSMFELSDMDAMLENAEKYPRQAVYDTLKALNETDPENPKVMWRFARAAYELSGESKDKAVAKTLMEEAHTVIKAALELDKTDSDIHRWCGNILNGMSAFISTKESIANSYRIREHWQDAISVNPNDATAKALLGRWAYSVASLSWFKRNIAKALFGTPPVATYEEALEFFEGAERTEPGFWMMNRVMIAKTYNQLGKKDLAAEWAQKALELPARSLDDQEAKKEAEALLKKLGK